mgnify:CR=1 FL=1
MKRIESNLWRYQLFAIFSFTPIMLPILVLFWQDNGLDLFEIYLLQGIFAFSVVLLEVPTGMIADQLGKRTSLVASTLLLFFGFVVYAMGTGFWIFLLSELILAVAVSLLSGADSALLYDTLKALGRESEYQKYEGRSRGLQMVSVAISNIIGGFVGAYSLRLAMWLSAIGPLLSIFIVWGFVEVNQHAARKQSLKASLLSYRELLGQSLRFVRKHQMVRWQILFLSILSGSASWLLWMYQPYMKWTGLEIHAFGFAFGIFNLFAAWSSTMAHRVESSLGASRTNQLLILLQISPLLLMSVFIHPLSFLFILGHQAVRGLARPIISDRILQQTYADKRATVLSMGSMGSRLFFAFTGPFIGILAQNSSWSVKLLSQAGIMALIFAIILWIYHNIPAKYFVVKESVVQNQ